MFRTPPPISIRPIMQSVPNQLDTAFRKAIREACNLDADPIVGISQNEKFGDYQSNAAMGLAKQLKSNPRAVAEQIKAKLDLGEIASEVSIAGPGFINVRLNPPWVAQQLRNLTSDERLGIPRTSSPQTVVVDYSGPNIAKQMHVGHLRSTIIGDAISRVIEFQGNNVIRQNHIGDWGTQFGMLITYVEQMNPGEATAHDGVTWTKDAHGHLLRAAGLRLGDLEEFYRAAKTHFDESEPFRTKARDAVVKLQSGDALVKSIWEKIVDESRRHYHPVYERLNVQLRQEHERGESFYNPFLPDVVKELKEKGIAEESEGAVVVFVDGKEKSPLIIQKSGGGYLYGTTDLAGIRYRVNELHATRSITSPNRRICLASASSNGESRITVLAFNPSWPDFRKIERMRAYAYCRYGAVFPSSESIVSQLKT